MSPGFLQLVLHLSRQGARINLKVTPLHHAAFSGDGRLQPAGRAISDSSQALRKTRRKMRIAVSGSLDSCLSGSWLASASARLAVSFLLAARAPVSFAKLFLVSQPRISPLDFGSVSGFMNMVINSEEPSPFIHTAIASRFGWTTSFGVAAVCGAWCRSLAACRSRRALDTRNEIAASLEKP